MDIATQHRPSLRLLLGAVALSATLPLTACANGAEPSEPTSSSASDPSTPSGTASATVDPAGKWTSPEAGEPFLEFNDDGSVSGSDGCNAIKTSWTLDGDTITIEPFTTTQRACAGVDAWLSKAATATIEGDIMTVKDGQGSVIGGLEKQ